MPKKSSSSSKSTSLFDIRLKNLDHDVLVLKGNENDAASVLLSGKICLSVNEPFTIKKLSIKLYATLKLSWNETVTTSKGGFSKPVRFSKKIFEHNWDNSEINQYLNNLYENNASVNGGSGPIGLSSRNQSTSSLKNLGSSLRSKSSSNLTGSSTNLASLNGSSSNLSSSKSHLLVQGNYEIPFSSILPGNMPESIEGLPGASLVYRLEATIDKGKFHNPMVAKKHIRVIRTLTTDSVELSETVAVDNTWPKKVEYSLNVPQKAIAIGSGTPVSFMMVPLLKGLRLGDIKIQLVEYYSFLGYLPPPYNGERIVTERKIKQPDENDPNFQMDKWEVDTFLRVPPSLAKCTQDCDIQQHVKVRHKLKFVIGLVNPDGHVSELRASLPIQLFISPFVSIRARNEENLSDVESIPDKNDHKDTANTNGDENPHGRDEELLFATDFNSASNTSLSELADQQANNGELRSNEHSYTSFNGIMAPPLYEQHIYDRLWSDISPIESPMNSGTSTPRLYSRGTSDLQQQFSMSPLDSNLLTENLRQLSLQRLMQDNNDQQSVVSTPDIADESPRGAIFNLDGDDSASQNGDYFSSRRTNSGLPIRSGSPNLIALPSNHILNAGGLQSPPNHISRIGSDTSLLHHETLSKVPTYAQAMKSDVTNHEDGVLSPVYQPPLPGSGINLAELNRRFDESPHSPHMVKTSSSLSNNNFNSRSLLSRGSSSLNLRTSSKNSSASTSPSQSRNVSSSNLVSLSRTSSKRSGSGLNLLNHAGGNVITNGNGQPLTTSSSVVSNSIHYKTLETPSHIMNPTPSSSSTSTNASLLAAALQSGASTTKPSSSATDRSASTPIKSSSSVSLHNLSFLNRKKEKSKN
ncbi:O-dinitrobenzene, calcium and zinc resistance protein [Scheffersomyces coipomensis]|uniref:O-dinitrobenzene, calcium and zinc resistance protein n=1 Tax=Scheffersomyces coipomensis TaxID=1788519 RepID=UPI00315DF00A